MSSRSRCRLLAVLVGLVLPALAHANDGESPAERIVRDYTAAFNARELDRMLAFTTDEVEWLSIDGAKVTTETAGRDLLRDAMEIYFRDCPSCRSELLWIEAAGSRVAAFERASWTAKDGREKSQSSLSVYELVDGRIARVSYFPAEK